jgi:hypothetical protein
MDKLIKFCDCIFMSYIIKISYELIVLKLKIYFDMIIYDIINESL